jgi:hypothetical protein
LAFTNLPLRSNIDSKMIVHLVDGTYELFRHFYGLRRFNKGKDRQYGAVVGVLQTVLQIIENENGDTYVGVATDHVIESFRNRLWADYKTGAGIERALLAQFHPLEEALAAMGVVVWPMIELEADDALASAAHLAAKDKKVERVAIWTPDKDLAQCVRGTRVVQIDGRRKTIRDAAGVREKFGVAREEPRVPCKIQEKRTDPYSMSYGSPSGRGSRAGHPGCLTRRRKSAATRKTQYCNWANPKGAFALLAALQCPGSARASRAPFGASPNDLHLRQPLRLTGHRWLACRANNLVQDGQFSLCPVSDGNAACLLQAKG